METTVIKNIPFELNKDNIVQRMHIHDDEDRARVHVLLDEALRIGNPKGIYAEWYIDEKDEHSVRVGHVTFLSKVMRINLDQVYKVYPYVATCGTELEAWSNSLTDPLESFWADTIKQVILKQAVSYLKEHLESNYRLGKTSSMNPGSLEDWPISEQKKLFSLLKDIQQEIGVVLTESFLMLPTKTVSGIIFPADTGFENCQLCKRERCPGRRAPFDQVLYRETYRLNPQ